MRFARDNTGARKRSANGHKKRAQGNVVVISGESLSIEQVAERLGVSRDATTKRLRNAKALPGPVTWESMGMKR